MTGPGTDAGGETLVSSFHRACRARGKAAFFTDPDERLSGDAVAARAGAFASLLRDRGIAKGDVVAFLCASSACQAVAFFACQILGAVVCCLHPGDTASRLARTLDFIEAKAIVADDFFLDDARTLAAGRTVIAFAGGDGEPSAGEDRAAPFAPPAPDDAALILLSSGTTGDPKCVLHTQATLAATASMGRHVYGHASPDDSVIVVMAPSFAAWIHTVLPFVHGAGRVHFDGRFEPERFLRALVDEGITVAPLVPTAWRMVLAAEPAAFDLSRLGCAFYSGEPGSDALVRALSERICANVRTAYLASEGGNAAGVVAGPEILAGAPAAAGRPVPGAAARVVDPDGGIGDDLPAGETGEIVVRGGSVSPGYLKQPGGTAARFAGGWWRSGDLGWLDGRGVLFVKGRLDNRINSGGVKISAEEIEAALLRHPGIRQAGVVGEPDARWGERIEAHIVVDGALGGEAGIAAFLERDGSLPRHLWPKAFHFRDALPVGPTGKLYRRGLKHG